MKRKKRKKWKERKRKKDENKEKNKKEEERFPVEGRREVKRERSNSRLMKERGQKFFMPKCHSKSFSTGNIPPHMNKEEKTETPSFLSKKHYPRENPIGP